MASPQSTTPSGSRALYHVAVGVRATELQEAPQIAHVVAHLGVDVGVEDLVLLVARAGHHPALRIDEERRAEVVTIGRAADVLAHLVDAAHVEHVGDCVAAQLDFPDVADPLAIGRGRHQEQVRAPQAEHPGGLREVAVVADEDADLEAERRIEDREAEVAGLEEEALVAGRLSRLHGAENLGDGHLAVLADELAIGTDHHGRVVQDAAVVLVERVDDDRPRLLRHPAQAVDGGAGDGLGGLEPLLVAVEAEVDGRAELREAHHLGPIASGLPGEALGFLDIDVLVDVSTELSERYPYGHRIGSSSGMARPGFCTAVGRIAQEATCSRRGFFWNGLTSRIARSKPAARPGASPTEVCAWTCWCVDGT